MMYKDIKRFLCKFLLFTIPFFIFVGWYVYLDPFEIFWHYDNFYVQKSTRLSLNQGYVSMSNFDNHYDEYKWDSYIFGNSRSRYYNIEDWETCLPVGCRGYHFDAHGESLLGSTKKIEYLDEKNIELKNFLLVMDAGVLGQIQSSETHIFMIPPKLLHYSNWIKFQTTNFGVFCNLEFIKICLSLRQNATQESATMEELISGELFDYDYRNNQIKLGQAEQQILEGNFYTEDLIAKQFSNNEYPDSISPAIIGDTQKQMLVKIHDIVEKHHVNCKIVISPLWDKIKLNPTDVEYLKTLFGYNNVWDFSGKNIYTKDFHNYYEHSHYSPYVAKQIMREIYK